MSATQFAMGGALIAIGVVVAMFFLIRWAEGRPLEREPIEHGDGEPD